MQNVAFYLLLDGHGTALSGVGIHIDANDADDGGHLIFEGKVLSGLGLHQQGQALFLLLHILHDVGDAAPHHAGVGDAVAAGNIALERFYIALQGKAYSFNKTTYLF